MIADVLGPALGVALSPFPVIPAILLLFTPRPRAAAGGFLAGWVTGVTGAALLFWALSAVVEGWEDTPTWASWARIVLGVLLLGFGVRQWADRGGAKETPGWMRSVETATPAFAVRLGVLLSAANPKIVLFAAAAGLAVGSASESAGQTAVALTVFVLVASVSVALPLMLHLVLGARILSPLGAAKARLERHNAAIMAVVITAIGVLVLTKGLSGL